MDDYQKSFLTDDYIDGMKEYVKRMEEITPNTDGDDGDEGDTKPPEGDSDSE